MKDSPGSDGTTGCFPNPGLRRVSSVGSSFLRFRGLLGAWRPCIHHLGKVDQSFNVTSGQDTLLV